MREPFIKSLLKLKLLPVLIVSCTLLLGLKINSILNGAEELIASTAFAESAGKPSKSSSAAGGGSGSGGSGGAGDIASGDSSAQSGSGGGDTTSSMSSSSRIAASIKNAGDENAARKVERIDKKMRDVKVGDQMFRENISRERPEENFGIRTDFTQIEVDILQSLAERRKTLDEWEDQIKLKENLLAATEARIEQKIEDLKQLKSEVEEILAKYDNHENEKIKSLVKIYENMKPKDAARIFNDMDTEILLNIASKMSERRASAIFAKMDSERARQLTVELAEYLRVKDEIMKMNEDINKGSE